MGTGPHETSALPKPLGLPIFPLTSNNCLADNKK